MVWFQALVGITGTAGLHPSSSVLISMPVTLISTTQLYTNSQTVTVNISNPVGVTNAIINSGAFSVMFNGNIFQVSQINSTNPSSSHPFFIYYSGFYFIKV